jgi:hypothetical protein
LIVSEPNTVDAINRFFVLEVRNQSSLKRLLTERPFAVSAFHQAHLAFAASARHPEEANRRSLSTIPFHPLGQTL